jgi:hypothetical protein
MADTSGQALIRGIDINKIAIDYAEEAIVLQNLIRGATTTSRELRYYTKTAGYLDSTDTTAITASQIYNVAELALPVVVEQSWTRNTAYVKLFKVESPWISIEDIKDNDVDIWTTHLKDLVLAVKNQIDTRILSVLGDTLGTGGSVNTAAAVADGWDDDVTGNPILDILTAEEYIRVDKYDPSDFIMYMHPGDYTSLMNYLISVKGSSIPQFASEIAKGGVVSSVLGHRIIVNTNTSEDTVVCFKPMAAVWKSFMPLQTHVIDNPGIGKKIRIVEEGECILEHPLAVHVITDVKV